MARIAITPNLSIDEREIREEFVRASGPGGQNVNKVSTSVQLYFDAGHSPSLPHPVRERLLELAGGRATTEGVLVFQASRRRTQEQNRAEARARLIDLILRAATPPPVRRKTHAPLASTEKRLKAKRKLGQQKQLRRRLPQERE